MNESLKVNNISKTFKLNSKQMKNEKTTKRTKTAVNDISFSVNRGEIYGLLGPNGAGKTTTLRIISTLIKPDSGDVLVEGCSVKSEPEKVREQIGFLTSELKLEDYFTPNYLFDFFSNLYGVENKERAERKSTLFEKFGINRFADVKVADLSTGMKQKVSLCISLVNDPQVIIFDEPTNGLDIITAKTVTDFLLELKEQGKTIILSTHVFELAEKICDRVGIIINGKLCMDCKMEDIENKNGLEEIFFKIYNEEASA